LSAADTASREEPSFDSAEVGMEASKEQRSGSFGAVASDYERFRPGPPVAAVEWLLPDTVRCVVDLGAGTGALTRLLVDRAVEVVAVEPDDRMRAVLAEQVPAATALQGRAESMPLPDSTVDAILASSSWHWVDPVPAVTEAARVLVPAGILAAVWSGPDPDGAFMSDGREMLSQLGGLDGDAPDAAAGEDSDSLTELILGDAMRPEFVLAIPPGLPFSEPEHRVFSWDVALDADELIGLLGTLSWIITMADDRRGRVIATARRLLEDLGIVGDATVDVTFRADAWRCRRDTI
jgi:SAM-dependent methyltransferase